MKIPERCPFCGVDGSLVDEGQFYHCSDSACGVNFLKAIPKVKRVRRTPKQDRPSSNEAPQE